MKIDKELRGNIQTFIKNLTDADDAEIKKYISEIVSDKKLENSLAKNRISGTGKSHFPIKSRSMWPPAWRCMSSAGR